MASALCRLRCVGVIRQATESVRGLALTSAKRLPEPKVTQSHNGVNIVCIEEKSPLSTLSVYYKGGACTERTGNLGATHALRVCAGLSGKRMSQFGIYRNLQQLGAVVECGTGKQHVSYTLTCNRGTISDALKYMTELVCYPAFYQWEISDNTPRLALDLALMKPQVRVMEKLHKVAFRESGVGISIYSPQHKVGKHSSKMLDEFMQNHMHSGGTWVIGSGVGEKDLVDFADTLDLDGGMPPARPSSKYTGGGEWRQSADTSGLAYVAVGVEGIGAKDLSQAFAFEVLSNIMGSAPRIYNKSPTSSLLYKEAILPLKEDIDDVSIRSFSLSYSDTGLFGFLAAGPSHLVGQVVNKGASTLRNTKVTKDELDKGKNQLKETILSHRRSNTVNVMGWQGITIGKVVGLQAAAGIVDKLTLEDVNRAAGKVGSGWFCMASYGDVSWVPYLDSLPAGRNI